MTTRSRLIAGTISLCAVLMACEQGASPEDQVAPENAEQHADENATAAEMDELEAQRPLNMTVPMGPPMDPSSRSDLQADYSKPKTMPDLFKESEKKKSEGRTKGGGKLITEEGGEDYFDSVKGAEVKIEVKMK